MPSEVKAGIGSSLTDKGFGIHLAYVYRPTMRCP